MREVTEFVSHQQASQLLHNKFIVVLGDSIQRSVYKDLVLLLQKDKYLTSSQLKSKGEMTFEQDCLVEGGCLGKMHNGTEYREVRQFQSAHHLVRFYFVTRIYSDYMQSILEDFSGDFKPDVVIVNSCIWDISRYKSSWTDDYKTHLNWFFDKLNGTLPKETLVIWSLAMPLGKRLKGGFLVPEIKHKASHLRFDVVEANFYSGTLADSYGMDVLDFHFHFRFSLHHRTKDGAHWNAIAHRRITSLLLLHAAQAWGVIMPCPLTPVENNEVSNQQQATGDSSIPTRERSASNYHYLPPTNYFSDRVTERQYAENNGYKDFSSRHLSFDGEPQPHRHKAAAAHRRGLPSQPSRHLYERGHIRNDLNYSHHPHENIIRSRHSRHHYAPYTHHRPSQSTRHRHYY